MDYFSVSKRRMAKLKLEDSGTAIRILFFVSITLLAVLSVVNYRADLDVVTKGNWVSHTNKVKFQLEGILSRLKDAEAGARGYLLTRDSFVLAPFTVAEKVLPKYVAEVRTLTADNPLQQKNLEVVEKQIADKLAFLRALLTRDAVTPEEIRRSKADMDALRAEFSIMQQEEDRLLIKRENELRQSVSFAPVVTVVLAASSILLLVFSYFRLNRELERSKKLRTDIEDANVVLEKSNAELSQFAYVASHDLQEPLRKIQTFVSRIEDDEQVLPGKTGEYFDRIKNSAARMQKLIRDILAYSRVNNAGDRRDTFSLTEIANEAREAVDVSAKEKNAEIIIGTLPRVSGVHYQLVQLFQNLISNSIKFSDAARKNTISISADRISGTLISDPRAKKAIDYYKINVSDTGIGFEPEYGDRIFKIFQRLHLKEAYEGNGIGLSIVQKIAENHAGFVTATGKPGEGAVFSFYLPA